MVGSRWCYGLVVGLFVSCLWGCADGGNSSGTLEPTDVIRKQTPVDVSDDPVDNGDPTPAPPPVGSVEGFEIESLGVLGLSPTLARVTWTTPGLSDSELHWGRTTALEGVVVLQPESVLNHCVLLRDLEPGTTYYYQVFSRNAEGLEAESEVLHFTTPAEDGVVVRSSHPRILFNDSDLPRIRSRIAGSHAEEWRRLLGNCESALSRSAADLAVNSNNYEYARALAFAGLVGGDSRFRRKALDVGLECARQGTSGSKMDIRRRLITLASVHDWIHSYISSTDRATLRSAMLEQMAVLEAGLRTTEFVWGHSHGHQRPLFLAALTLYHESSEAREILHAVVEDYQHGYLATWRNYSSDGGSLKGWWYTTWTLNMEVELLASLRSGTDLDWFPDERWMEHLLDWYALGLRGDNSFCRSGDSRISDGLSGFDWIYALCVAHHYQSPRARWLAGRIVDAIGQWSLRNFYDILWDDPSLTPQQPDGPLSRLFRSSGQVVLRSSWERDAVIATFRSAPDYTLGHTHRDNNSFTIYHRGGLAIDSGIYDDYGGSHHRNYYTRTIAHNSMLVFDPSEDFLLYGDGYVNDGGQRWLIPGVDVESSLPAHVERILDPGCGYLAGGIRVFEDTDEYSYSMGDAAPSYSPAKLKVFDRHFLWLKSVDGLHWPVTVIYDLVESTSSSFKKTYLLHTQNQPEVRGTFVIAESNGGVLHQQTLLPASPRLELVGGDGREFWVNGRNYPPSRTPKSLEEAGRYRVEVSPSEAALEDEFLHVLYAGDVGCSAPAASLVDAGNMTGLTLVNWTILFGQDIEGSAEVACRAQGGGQKYLLVGMVPRGVYEIRIDGSLQGSLVASSRGTLRFDCLAAGQMHIVLSPAGDGDDGESLAAASTGGISTLEG